MYNNCIWKHLLIAHFWKAQTSVFQHYQTGCLTTMVVSYHLGFDLSQLFCLGVQVQLNILCRWMWKQQNLIVYTTNHASKLSVSITSCHSGQLHMYFQHLLQGGSSPRACRHWSAMYYWDMLFWSQQIGARWEWYASVYSSANKALFAVKQMKKRRQFQFFS